ncbi:MAG TPA: hypothetical protein VMT34_05595 [Aggregatilineales bacterium]|nr:hypothetical protein [Aggregatilineales bacterium]
MQGNTYWEKSLRPLVDHAMQSGRPLWFDVSPEAYGIQQADIVTICRTAYAIMATEDELPWFTGGLADRAACDRLLAAGGEADRREARRVVESPRRTDRSIFPRSTCRYVTWSGQVTPSMQPSSTAL